MKKSATEALAIATFFIALFYFPPAFAARIVYERKPLPKGCAALLTEIRGSRALIKAWSEEKADDHWPVDSARIENRTYDASFAAVLPERTLESLAVQRLASGKSVHYLDLFGSGNVIGLDALSSATGARLVAWKKDRPDRRKGTEDRKKYDVVGGDLFLESTWVELDQNLADRGIPALDLITILPVGGLSRVDAASVSFYLDHSLLLRRAYRRLSRDGGILLAQLSFSGHNLGFYDGWQKRLHEAGISAKIDDSLNVGYRLLRIEKGPKSPAILPL